jgi:hypothetical protein
VHTIHTLSDAAHECFAGHGTFQGLYTHGEYVVPVSNCIQGVSLPSSFRLAPRIWCVALTREATSASGTSRRYRLTRFICCRQVCLRGCCLCLALSRMHVGYALPQLYCHASASSSIVSGLPRDTVGMNLHPDDVVTAATGVAAIVILFTQCWMLIMPGYIGWYMALQVLFFSACHPECASKQCHTLAFHLPLPNP